MFGNANLIWHLAMPLIARIRIWVRRNVGAGEGAGSGGVGVAGGRCSR